jgi:RNA polymerase sigma factor (sigma-70 family)
MTMTAVLNPQPKPRRPQARLSGEQVTDLVDAAGAGDQSAWNRLVAEFGGMIWSIARAHRLGDADAADVSQATWLALFENLRRLNDPARVGAWLATTARRECLRVLRDGHRRIPFGDDGPEQESHEPQPGDALLTRERDGALQRAFSRLRPADQALLRLLAMDPRPAYEEISAALDMPIGSIGPTRQRALDRLREQLARQQTLSLMTD